jgi:hypothetical protein
MTNLGKETTVAGMKLDRLELSVIEAWRDWIAEREGFDPAHPDQFFAELKGLVGILPEEEIKEAAKQKSAIRNQLKNFSLGCPLAQEYLRTEIGMGNLYLCMLKKHQPNATIDDAFAVLLADGGKSLPAATGEVSEGNGKAPRGSSEELLTKLADRWGADGKPKLTGVKSNAV